jgi:hypothetical protein
MTVYNQPQDADGVRNTYVAPMAITPLTSAGPTWTNGKAAPTAIEPVGSLYSRIGGAIGSTLYVSRGSGTWAPVSGV